MTVYVFVRLSDTERTQEWRAVEVDDSNSLDALRTAIKVAEQMPDVEVCLESSLISGGIPT